MRKKLKRYSTVIATSLIAASLLAACSGATNGVSSASAGTKSNATINYYSMWNSSEPQGQVITQAVADFKAQTGITVNVSFQGRDTRQTLQPALDSGEAIDIFDEDLDRVNTTWAKYLINLEDYASKTYATTDGKPYTDAVNTKLIDLARSLGPEGKLSSIPYQPSTFVVMYNKDIFSQAGIKTAPQTWDEWMTDCGKIKAIGKTPITVDDAYIASLFGYHMARLVGSDTVYKMVANNDFSSPAVLTFGQQWQKMYENGYVSKNASGNIYPAGQQEVALGNVAMYLNGTWLPNEIKNSTPPDFKWGSFAYPTNGSSGDGTNANQYGAQCFAINKNSKNPAQAFQFIVFMTTGKWDSQLAKDTIGVPMANDAVWPTQLAEAKTVFDNTTIRYRWAVDMENNADIQTKVKTNFQLLISGKANAQQFANAMNQK